MSLRTVSLAETRKRENQITFNFKQTKIHVHGTKPVVTTPTYVKARVASWETCVLHAVNDLSRVSNCEKVLEGWSVLKNQLTRTIGHDKRNRKFRSKLAMETLKGIQKRQWIYNIFRDKLAYRALNSTQLLVAKFLVVSLSGNKCSKIKATLEMGGLLWVREMAKWELLKDLCQNHKIQKKIQKNVT